MAVLVLGNGSNLLVADAGFPGMVVVLGRGFVEHRDRTAPWCGPEAPPVSRSWPARAGGRAHGLEWAVGVPGIGGGRPGHERRWPRIGHRRRARRLPGLRSRRRARSTKPAAACLGLGYRRSSLRRRPGGGVGRIPAGRRGPGGGPRRRWPRSCAGAGPISPGGSNAGSVFTQPRGRLRRTLGGGGRAQGPAHGDGPGVGEARQLHPGRRGGVGRRRAPPHGPRPGRGGPAHTGVALGARGPHGGVRRRAPVSAWEILDLYFSFSLSRASSPGGRHRKAGPAHEYRSDRRRHRGPAREAGDRPPPPAAPHRRPAPSRAPPAATSRGRRRGGGWWPVAALLTLHSSLLAARHVTVRGARHTGARVGAGGLRTGGPPTPHRHRPRRVAAQVDAVGLGGPCRCEPALARRVTMTVTERSPVAAVDAGAAGRPGRRVGKGPGLADRHDRICRSCRPGASGGTGTRPSGGPASPGSPLGDRCPALYGAGYSM